jgi:hypothetical protein
MATSPPLQANAKQKKYADRTSEIRVELELSVASSQAA